MKLEENYHDYSIIQEQNLYSALLIPYGELLNSLNEVKDLSKENIDNVIKNWNGTYQTQIDQEIASHVKRLEQYSQDSMEAQDLSGEAIKLIDANKSMLDVTTEYVRQKFIEIGINENVYGYNSQQVNDLMDEVLRITQDKLETFAIQSTIQNLAQFIKIAALTEGYTEYKWHTQRDNKVRPSHVHMDAKWFSLDDESPQPAGFKPGIDWGCRCWMCEFR